MFEYSQLPGRPTRESLATFATREVNGALYARFTARSTSRGRLIVLKVRVNGVYQEHALFFYFFNYKGILVI
ncbi:hypothetical protein Hanom_Chr15g01398181 [Helianthus anomalus]